MKSYIIKTATSLLVLAIIFSSSAFAAKSGDFSKPIKKEFQINKGATLNIDSEFTDIKAFNWDKDIISIEVTITVDAKNEAKSQEKLEKVVVDIDGNSSQVNMSTNIESGFFGNNNNNNIEIEVLIYYPSHINLDLENEFGNSIFEDISGSVNVEVAYGSFEAGNLSHNELDLQAEFGHISVNMFKAGKVDVAYGGFVTQEAGDLKLSSAFSNNEIEEVKNLQLRTAYDKVFIGQLQKGNIESEFTNLRIDNLLKHLELETAYGSFRMDNISKDFEMINISTEFTAVDLLFAENASFAFKAHVEMGNLKYPKEKAHITYIEKEMMDLKIEGYIGNAKGQTPKVILDVQHANAKLKFK